MEGNVFAVHVFLLHQWLPADIKELFLSYSCSYPSKWLFPSVYFCSVALSMLILPGLILFLFTACRSLFGIVMRWKTLEVKVTIFYRSLESDATTLEEWITHCTNKIGDWTKTHWLNSLMLKMKERRQLKVGNNMRFKGRIASIAFLIYVLDLQWDFVISRPVLKRSNSSCRQKDAFSCTSE